MRRVGIFALILAGLAGLTLAFYGERGGANPASAEAVTRVTVKATEFKFTLSKRSVPTGTVIFTVINKGKIAHDFKITNKRTAVIRPGKSATLRVRLTKKGQYRYLCTLPGHAAAGMKGVLAVGPPPPPTGRVTVKATEFKFTLSKRSVPTGTVIFTVINKGKIAHDFKITNKRTAVIRPGKSATLRVTFTKNGEYRYLCTLPGHAAAGMKGVLAVGRKPPPPPPTGTTTAPIGAPIPGAPTTTITVSMTEFHFTLSSESVKAGTNATFVITNAGHTVHNFDLVTVHAGKIIDPGQSESWTVGFPNARSFTYVCDVPYHAQSGMEGTFTVTP